MNIIIYTVVILFIFYFLLRFITSISSKKISKGIRFLIILGLIGLAILFAVGGKFLLTLPLTLASIALLKLKGLSIFQLISLFRLIQTLRKSGRFSFNQSNSNNVSSISHTISFTKTWFFKLLSFSLYDIYVPSGDNLNELELGLAK